MDGHAVGILCKPTRQEIKLTVQIFNFSHKTTCLKNKYINKRVERPACFRRVQAVKSGSSLGMPGCIGWHEVGFKLCVLLQGTGKADTIYSLEDIFLHRFIFF